MVWQLSKVLIKHDDENNVQMSKTQVIFIYPLFETCGCLNVVLTRPASLGK